MKAAISKENIQAVLSSKLGNSHCREKKDRETLAAGISEVDVLSKGFPRGAITEIVGAPSSGRTSLLISALAQATWQEEACALIDTNDNFDPIAAANGGVAFDHLLWVRCGSFLERAFRATDLILQSGGFGLVVLDMANVAAQDARRIISSWWYRFRLAIENTPAALIVISHVPSVRSCASLSLELGNTRPVWAQLTSVGQNTESGASKDAQEQLAKNRPRLFLVGDLASKPHSYNSLPTHARLLRGSQAQVSKRKPTASIGSVGFRIHSA